MKNTCVYSFAINGLIGSHCGPIWSNWPNRLAFMAKNSSKSHRDLHSYYFLNDLNLTGTFENWLIFLLSEIDKFQFIDSKFLVSLRRV